MNFLTELNEKRKKLSHVTTTITTATGQKYVEDGLTIVKLNKTSGYVVDLKPDLQVAKVLPWLYFGSQDVANDHNLLISSGITDILSLGIDPIPHCDRINYKLVQLLDLPDSNLLKIIEPCIDFINSVKELNGIVFIHCNAGVSRSASLVIAYLINEKRISYQCAHDILKNIRPCIKPNQGFVNQLKMYESYCL